MVDPHQVLIDNGNTSSKISDTPIQSANLIPMNESDPLNHQNQRIDATKSLVSDCGGFQVNNKQIGANRQNVDKWDGIMCGPSPRNSTTSTLPPGDNNNSSANSARAFLVDENGDGSSVTSNHFQSSANEQFHVNANALCVIVNKNQTNESNDSRNKRHRRPSTSCDSADTDLQEFSAEFQPHATIAVEKEIGATGFSASAAAATASNKMDSRKVEPLRININRDPIKTKIKLGPPAADRQTMSPKSSSSSNAGIDECDDASETTTAHENQQIYPKITIKPIVKPPSEQEHHHNHSGSSHAPSSSHEAIPKLKIKKVDANNSNSNLTPLPTHSAVSNSDDIGGNYQTHLLSESNPSVPK